MTPDEMNIRAEQLRLNREKAKAFRVAAEELRTMKHGAPVNPWEGPALYLTRRADALDRGEP